MSVCREAAMREKVCDIFLQREKDTLSKHAFLTANTRGRKHAYTPCINRTEFQRDRDKIIHSKAFRRLMHKTQVFLLPIDEHYRNRMTHTLEVTQIARIIARALRLNEDLAEAGALGHDLGHTPFGHAGEEVMRKCYSPDFSHSEQSLRVVEKLENNGEGLNLTYEVRDAIRWHNGETLASTLEGTIVKFADRIAYINHDIDDALRGGILQYDDIPRDILSVLGDTHSRRINRMVSSVIYASENMDSIQMEPHVWEATCNLRAFLFDTVYKNPIAKGEEKKAKLMLEGLYDYFINNPERMPAFFIKIAENEGLSRAVCDYVSGMTDRYAIDTFKKIYIPLSWKVDNND